MTAGSPVSHEWREISCYHDNPAEFNECFASGEAFEASEELAAQMGSFYPVVEDVLSDEEFFAPPRTERGGLDEC